MLQKSGYGIVIQVLSTSQCSAVLLSQYNPPFLPLQNPQRWSAATYLMNSKRWLFLCLFRVFMIQISMNTQGSVNSCSSGSAAPITGADLLVTTGIVIQYYSDNMNIFPILSDPQTWNFLRTAQGSHGAALLGKHTRLSVESDEYNYINFFFIYFFIYNIYFLWEKTSAWG